MIFNHTIKYGTIVNTLSEEGNGNGLRQLLRMLQGRHSGGEADGRLKVASVCRIGGVEHTTIPILPMNYQCICSDCVVQRSPRNAFDV